MFDIKLNLLWPIFLGPVILSYLGNYLHLHAAVTLDCYSAGWLRL